MPEMKLKDGRLSMYALACGYIDRDVRECESGRKFIIDLSHNGATYDVDAYFDGVPREMIRPVEGGPGIQEGWAQFDTLTEARKFKARMLRMPDTANIMVACLGVMAHLLPAGQ